MKALVVLVQYAEKMIPMGYMLKKAVNRPDWIKADSVKDVYSVSGCICNDFADYVNFWKHNGYWFFDSPRVIEEIAAAEGIDVSEMKMFYYEVYETEFDDQLKQWIRFSAEDSFPTAVIEPQNKQLAGFDVTTFSQHTTAECSPLSCCSLATELPVNEHCLFNTFDEAKSALEEGFFTNSEPGPFRIFAVYGCS